MTSRFFWPILHFDPSPPHMIETKVYAYLCYIECTDLSYSISFYFLKITSHDRSWQAGHWVSSYTLKNAAISHGMGYKGLCGFATLRLCCEEEQSGLGSCHPGAHPPWPQRGPPLFSFSAVVLSLTSQSSPWATPKTALLTVVHLTPSVRHGLLDLHRT